MAYGRHNTHEAPCYQCEDRHMGCHSQCEKYKEYVNAYRDRNRYMYGQINPPGSRYYKERAASNIAPHSKKRYR